MSQQTTAKDQAGTVAASAVPKQVLPQPLGAARKQEPVRATPPVVASDPAQALMRCLDVPLTLIFEVGRTAITIGQLMELNKGSFIDLWQVSVDVIDIRINERIVAQGEAITVNQHYGIRFGELVLPLGQEGNANAV